MEPTNLFDRYASHTDGKRLIAQAIQTLVDPRPEVVLDVGAGNGEIAQHLGQWANQIVAIEPSTHLAQRIRDRGLRNVKVIDRTIQNVNDTLAADLAVLSYFLDVLDEDI